MSNEILTKFQLGDLDAFTLGNLDATDKVLDYINGISPNVMPDIKYETQDQITGLYAEISSEYGAYYVTLILSLTIPGIGRLTQFDTVPNVIDFPDLAIPYDSDDSYTIAITDVPFADLVNNPSLVTGSFIKALGVNLVFAGDVQEPEEPEVPVETKSTFLTLRNNDSLAKIVDVFDLFNAWITERINGPYTFDFNILPFTNVYRIYPPNIVEVDNDYFRVSRIQKVRDRSLMMTVSCEHISYELNDPPEYGYEWTEDTYSGYVYEILQEMLQGSRFRISVVAINGYIEEFTTKAKGFRSRILELAAYVNAEVKWDRFNVSIVEARGADNGVTLEVGKNIRSMTQNIDVRENSSMRRSYEVGVVDLNYIEDDISGNPLEMHSIQLGDTLTLIDEQFQIDHKDRVVSIARDPFRKALPEIEFANGMNDFFVNDTDMDITTSPSTGGGGGPAEVTINLRNHNEDIISVEYGEEGYDISLDEYSKYTIRPGVLSVKDSQLIFGIKILGEASEPAVLRGGITGDIYREDSNEQILLPNSFFATNLNPGYNTIGVPFSDVFPYPGDYRLHLKLSISAGNFKIDANNALIYVKGQKIEWVQQHTES